MDTDHKIIKEEHAYTSDEKIKWCGYGEWVEESDLVVIEYLGYEGHVLRVLIKEPFAKKEAYFGGHLCGYVKIPEDHPLFKETEINLECHGGLTFNEAHEEHWIGFDCGHSGDYVPTSELFKKKMKESGEFEPFPIPKEFEKFALFNPVYRNMEYCIGECKGIIDQLVRIKCEKTIQKT